MDTLQTIGQVRREWGDRLLILGHHYQDAAVVGLCDAVGDSLELSRLAAASKAERIVFCGVRFMAETADILTRGPDGRACGRSVWLPAPGAGCPMADMATAEALEAAWARLGAAAPGADWVPVVYVNSSAEVKAFCGRHGGSACTSGNGRRVVERLLAQGKRIFFAPDQHLSANIMRALGLADAYALWRRALPDGGLAPGAIRAARLVAWDGCCPIHAGYTLGDVQAARAAAPAGAALLIHPEAPSPVARLAEHVGSTKDIIEAVGRAEPGSALLIGTEDRLVRRLAAANRHLDIRPLRPILCEDMGRTTPEALLRTLTEWPEACRVRVDDALVPDARACVERMLAF